MDNFDLEYDKMIENYIKAEGLDNKPDNPLIPKNLQHAQLKEQVKNQMRSVELENYLNLAVNTLVDEGNKYIEPVAYETLIKQFSEASIYFNNINLTKPQDENLRAMLHIENDVMGSLLKIAQGEYLDNRLDASLSLFVLLSVLEPENPDYWYRLGIVAYQTEKYSLGVQSFTNAITLDPNFMEAKIYAAGCFIKLGQFKDAKNELSGIKNLFDNSMDSSWKDIINNMESNLKASN